MLHISTIAVRLHICIRNLNQICIEYLISRIQLFLKQSILSHGRVALDPSKKFLPSRISVSRIFVYVKQIFHWAFFSHYRKIPQLSQNSQCFLLILVFSHLPLAQLPWLCWQKSVKILKSIFFVLFLSNILIRFFNC